MNIILYYIRTLFNVNMLVIFILVGLFLLLRDVPLLKKKKLNKESNIANALAYIYIFGSIALFIIAKMI
ncbi:hypothetical protein KQI88_06655 [Alkaliphilus sp. MSJ-5]|uniref:Uncharacterized protein n=1 Tax=Alkaliphilus flagellatus TaxID=2841507 RepID=A0ABS6G0R7_9FIRM|nr:CLC_0170 family protein [Alkaliphilus flagellatus]MBU5676092.1 hypothetical protein [Alkaliphilus flagellatus]